MKQLPVESCCKHTFQELSQEICIIHIIIHPYPNPPISTHTSTKIAFGERHTHRHRMLPPFLPAGKLPLNVPRVIAAPTRGQNHPTPFLVVYHNAFNIHEVGKHARIWHNKVGVLRYNVWAVQIHPHSLPAVSLKLYTDIYCYIVILHIPLLRRDHPSHWHQIERHLSKQWSYGQIH